MLFVIGGVAGCGPQVLDAEGSESGGVSSGEAGGAADSGTTAALPGDASSSAVTSTSTSASTASSSSEGEVAPGTETGSIRPEMMEVEGTWVDVFKGGYHLVECGGEDWRLLDPPSWLPGCNAIYMRATVLAEPPPSRVIHAVDTVLEWRALEEGDCFFHPVDVPYCNSECASYSASNQCDGGLDCVPYGPGDSTMRGSLCVEPAGDDGGELGDPCEADDVPPLQNPCRSGLTCLGALDGNPGTCWELCEGPDATCDGGVCVRGRADSELCLTPCNPGACGPDELCTPIRPLEPAACVPLQMLPELFDPCNGDFCTLHFVCSADGLCLPE